MQIENIETPEHCSLVYNEQIVNFHWPHFIIENFLYNDDLKYLSNLEVDNTDNKVRIYANKIYLDGRTECSCLSKDFLIRFHERYHGLAMNILKILSPQKLNYYEYSCCHIVSTGKDYKFKVHDDIPDKLLSIVVYLYPSPNIGTLIYGKQQDIPIYESEWKTNRAFIFSRKEKQTWHSYQGNGITKRVALVYNLMTENPEAVRNIEGI